MVLFCFISSMPFLFSVYLLQHNFHTLYAELLNAYMVEFDKLIVRFLDLKKSPVVLRVVLYV